MFVIDHSTNNDLLFPTGCSRGLVPRDYSVQPLDFWAAPSMIPLVPKSEWSARIREQTERQSSLTHIRNRGNKGQPIPSLDQNLGDGVHWGYCWGHSVTHTAIAQRAAAGMPYEPLSAFALCAVVMKGQNKGGWCGLAAEHARNVGFTTQKFWPQKTVNLALDTPEMRADAATRKITEDFVDLTRPVWGQNLTFEQVASCLLLNYPCALDFNWWGHSVCGLRLVEVEAGSFGIEIWNSWADSWGTQGTGILRGSKAIPNGALATVATAV